VVLKFSFKLSLNPGPTTKTKVKIRLDDSVELENVFVYSVAMSAHVFANRRTCSPNIIIFQL